MRCSKCGGKCGGKTRTLSVNRGREFLCVKCYREWSDFYIKNFHKYSGSGRSNYNILWNEFSESFRFREVKVIFT